MSLDGWKRASFLVGSESNVRQWEPLPGGSVRPSGPCCFAVAKAPFVSLDGWKRASFLVGSESNVRQWEPLPGGSVRPSGPCCFAVAKAPFVSLDGWKRASFLVVQKATLGSGSRCPEARSVLQGPAVLLWRGRRL